MKKSLVSFGFITGLVLGSVVYFFIGANNSSNEFVYIPYQKMWISKDTVKRISFSPEDFNPSKVNNGWTGQVCLKIPDYSYSSPREDCIYFKMSKKEVMRKFGLTE